MQCYPCERHDHVNCMGDNNPCECVTCWPKRAKPSQQKNGGDFEKNVLASFSTADLEAELQRRREEAAAEAEKERKSREVVVVCLMCGGSGSSGQWQCGTCNGSGKVKAMLATPTNAE